MIFSFKFILIALLFLKAFMQYDEKITIKLKRKQLNLDLKSILLKNSEYFVNKNNQQKIAKLLNIQQNSKIEALNLNSSEEEIAQNIDRSYKIFKEILQLTNYQNFQYIGEISVEKNYQKFNVLFDTGSDTLQIPGDTCQTCDFSKNKYACNDQCSAINTKEITYGQGWVKGCWQTDQVIVGKKLTSFPFLSVIESKGLDIFKSDGIVGMGVNKNDSIVNKLYKEKQIEQNLFAFKLSTADMSNEQENQINSDQLNTDSELTIGGYNEKLIGDSDISYFQVVSSYYWAIKLASANYDKRYLFDKNKDLRIALIDSGTSLIHMPTFDFREFNSTIFEKNQDSCFEIGLIVCICTEKSIQNQPVLSLSFWIQIKTIKFITFFQNITFYIIKEFVFT